MKNFTTHSLLILFLFLCGCSHEIARMREPEDTLGPYREQIAAAKHLLEQKENWADRAEWEVVPQDDGWKVIAWRVEHPEGKGASRYLPWGYSVIQLDRRTIAVDYQRKG
jgi:hypothetical protein